MSFSLLSMVSIVLIAVERYFYIVHGIKYDNILTQNRIRLLILCSWFVAVGFGLVPELFYKMAASDAAFHCRFVNINPTVVVVAASVAIPALLVTAILYTVVFVHVRRATKAIHNGNSRMKFRSIVVVFLSSICFLLTWGPYMVTGFGYGVFCQKHEDNKTCKEMALALSSPLALLGFLNSVLNPIIYAWWHRPFNLAIRKLICPMKMRERVRKDMYDAASIDTISEKFDM